MHWGCTGWCGIEANGKVHPTDGQCPLIHIPSHKSVPGFRSKCRSKRAIPIIIRYDPQEPAGGAHNSRGDISTPPLDLRAGARTGDVLPADTEVALT